MKYILSTCPIHRGCKLQVVFGPDADQRIPLPDPDLERAAERDFPGLVPIEAKHLRDKRRLLDVADASEYDE